MSITHTVGLVWTSPNGGVNISATVSESADADQTRELTIAATTADQEFELDFEYAKLKMIFMLCDQGVLIETNANDATGGDSIQLVANIPFYWADSSGVTCPFTADVAKIFVTPPGAVASTLKIRALFDSAA
jgi:hypothetical protein